MLFATRIRDAEASASPDLGGDLRLRTRIAARRLPAPREANSIQGALGFPHQLVSTPAVLSEFSPFNGKVTCEEACAAGL